MCTLLSAYANDRRTPTISPTERWSFCQDICEEKERKVEGEERRRRRRTKKIKEDAEEDKFYKISFISENFPFNKKLFPYYFKSLEYNIEEYKRSKDIDN